MKLLHISFAEAPLWLSYTLLVVYSSLPAVATFLICLSREKHEDEYIEYIRARSVFIITAVFFSLLLVDASLTNVVSRIWNRIPFGYGMVFWVYTNPYLIPIFYIVIFKGALFINRIKTRNDRQ